MILKLELCACEQWNALFLYPPSTLEVLGVFSQMLKASMCSYIREMGKQALGYGAMALRVTTCVTTSSNTGRQRLVLATLLM